MSTQLHPKLPPKPGMGTYELMTFSQVTTSNSDRKYSFGRQSRFPKLNLQGTDQLCYDSPTTICKRGTNLGVGARFKPFNRYSLEKRPSPDSYQIPSLFNPDQTISSYSNFSRFQKGKQTHCFGAGRDHFKKTVVNAAKTTYPDPANPGPNHYRKDKPFGSAGVSFSLSYKIDFDHDTTVAVKRNHPAPGHYIDVAQFDKKGSYSVSNYKNSGATRFAREIKIPQNVMEAARFPGPGYHEHTGNVAQGFQPVSSFKTIATRTFGNEGRPEWASRFQTPGPGAYQPPCDFGYVTLSPRLQSYTMKNKETQKIYGEKPIQFKFPKPTHQKNSTYGSKTNLAPTSGMMSTTNANSGTQLNQGMLSETDARSPGASREVPYRDFEMQPKKTVNYNFHAGSNTNLKQGRRNLQSPTVSHGLSGAPFKNGTQLSFKAEPLNSPMYQSDQNANIQSLRSIPRAEDATQSDSQPVPLGQMNSFARDSTKDTAQNQSAGVNSGDIVPIKTQQN